MSFHPRYAGIAAILAVMATPLCAKNASTAGLEAAEDAYTHAVAGGDIGILASSLSEDLIYIHASGLAQNKQDYLKGTLDGGFLVRSARVMERRAAVYGRIGITQGRIAYDVGKGEKPAFYSAVYRKEGGQWRLLRWQNTRITESKP